MKQTKTLFITAALFLLLTLTSCMSLAEDITPPPGMEAPAPPLSTLEPPPAATPTGPSNPQTPPDPKQGVIIYLEKCAPCHGESGMGDGPESALLENPVPALGSEELARGAAPSDWYSIVTQGNMQAFMPPFSSLSDQERWDVVAYLYTLSAPQDMVLQGEAGFLENCAECHGEDGREGVVDLRDPEFMSVLSAEDLFSTITEGREMMPAFTDLSEADRWAMTAYLRSSTFVSSGEALEPDSSAEQAETAEEADAAAETEADSPSEDEALSPGFGNVGVRVVNNGDSPLPTNLEIVLRGYDEMTETYTQTLTLVDGDRIDFKEVPTPLGRVYIATIEYMNATFGSDIFIIEDDSPEINLEVAYNAPTTDPSILQVDRIHVFIDFVDNQTLEIYELYIFSNPTHQVLVPEEEDGSVVEFILPANASNLYVEDNMSLPYQKTDNGFGIANIHPNSTPHQAVFSFQVPYDGKKLDLGIPISMDANAAIVMSPANGFKLKSDQLEEAGTQDFEGMPYNMFTGSNFETGTTLDLNLSGSPKGDTSIIATGDDSKNSLVIGLVGFGAALIILGLFLWRRNQVEEEDEIFDDEPEDEFEDDSAEDIMDAIIALDDQYKADGLPEGAYRQRREMLKERLKDVIGSE